MNEELAAVALAPPAHASVASPCCCRTTLYRRYSAVCSSSSS